MPPSRAKRLESGLSIGLRDSNELEMKSRSAGNLSSVSGKSLGVSLSKRDGDIGEVPTDGDKGDVPCGKSLGISPSKGEDDTGEVLSDGDKGDVPSNQNVTAECTGTTHPYVFIYLFSILFCSINILTTWTSYSGQPSE